MCFSTSRPGGDKEEKPHKNEYMAGKVVFGFLSNKVMSYVAQSVVELERTLQKKL